MRSAELENIDIAATCLEHQFYSHHSFLAWLGFPRLEECLAAVQCVNLDFSRAKQSRFYLRSHNFFWWVYWTAYLQGYAEYLASGNLHDQNTYLRHLSDSFLALNVDPAMNAMTQPAPGMIAKRRFEMFDLLRRWGPAEAPPPEIEPAHLRATHSSIRKGRYLKVRERTETLCVRYFDGHHRLQMAALCGIQLMPCLVNHEPLHQEVILGEVEKLRFDGKRLVMQGWMLHRERPIQVVDVRVAHETTAFTEIHKRPDIASRFPEIPHAGQSGFSLDTMYEYLSPNQHIIFEAVGLNDWTPVGKVVAEHQPQPAAAVGSGRFASLSTNRTK